MQRSWSCSSQSRKVFFTRTRDQSRAPRESYFRTSYPRQGSSAGPLGGWRVAAVASSFGWRRGRSSSPECEGAALLLADAGVQQPGAGLGAGEVGLRLQLRPAVREAACQPLSAASLRVELAHPRLVEPVLRGAARERRFAVVAADAGSGAGLLAVVRGRHPGKRREAGVVWRRLPGERGEAGVVRRRHAGEGRQAAAVRRRRPGEGREAPVVRRG
mmetsp:Transcript_17331/g.55474  ORF Transcript_17331/g.55474 Transcript_17331/m.55474 type:complete len:216 (+) Transcript_17331:286-933(+)